MKFTAAPRPSRFTGSLAELWWRIAAYRRKPKTLVWRRQPPYRWLESPLTKVSNGRSLAQAIRCWSTADQGVGHIALQLAKHFGAEVYATGGGDPQLALIEELGATGINYKQESVDDYVAQHSAGKGFDIVYDSVGGMNMLKSFAAAKLNGHIASTVSLCEIDLSSPILRAFHSTWYLCSSHAQQCGTGEHHRILSELADIAEAGALRPVLDGAPFPLSEANEAHARLQSGKAMGKVVLVH